MNQFLESLEKMKDMPIVRFFSQFFTEDKLSPLFGRFHAGAGGRTPGVIATELLIWAVVLAIGTFAIDQAFYWTKPGRIDQARETWHSISTGAVSFGRGVKSLALRAKDAVAGKLEAPRGRR